MGMTVGVLRLYLGVCSKTKEGEKRNIMQNCFTHPQKLHYKDLLSMDNHSLQVGGLLIREN